MPSPGAVAPLFDGHPERPFREWTPDERLDWIWECMVLLRMGEEARSSADTPLSPGPGAGTPPLP